MGRFRTIVCTAAALGLGACANLSAQMNVPLADPDPQRGYRLGNLESAHSSDEILVIVSFSGGGKRSAAFAYGALTALRDMRFTFSGQERSLLHEIDLMAGVSGGSFPAAYYALHRDAIFENFHRDFLDVDFEGLIAGVYLLPWHWGWMVYPNWGTNDEMARIYDQEMFHGASFADLQKLGPPYTMIQATDLSTGAPFPFVQNQFDLICSDLAPYPVARAVAASNGFPVLFTPITLKNHSEGCAVPQPAWVQRGLRDNDPLSRQRQQALIANRYLNDRNADWVHLVDGGVGDNLALRGLLDYMARYDNPQDTPDREGVLRLRRVLFLSIDGQAQTDRSINRTPYIGGIFRVLDAVSSSTIDNYNFETLRVTRNAARNLAENLTTLRCQRGETGASAAMVHIALSDQPGAAALKDIPTGLTIAPADVEALIQAGRAAVLNHTTLREAAEHADVPVPCPENAATAPMTSTVARDPRQ